MARRPRYRPKPDLSPLEQHNLGVLFDGALLNRPYGGEYPRYKALANLKLIKLFEGHDALSDSEAQDRARAINPYRDWSHKFVAEYAGNLIGWGVAMGAVEPGPTRDGQRVWVMPDREPRYAELGGRSVQVRGLEPQAQAAMDKRVRAQAKLNATLNRKAAEAAAPEIVRLLDAIAVANPDTVIPDFWSHYVPADVRERWPRIAEAKGLLADLHHGWPRFWIKRWVGQLKDAHREALGRAAVRDRDAKARQERLTEDSAAFEDMDL